MMYHTLGNPLLVLNECKHFWKTFEHSQVLRVYTFRLPTFDWMDRKTGTSRMLLFIKLPASISLCYCTTKNEKLSLAPIEFFIQFLIFLGNTENQEIQEITQQQHPYKIYGHLSFKNNVCFPGNGNYHSK